MRIFAQVATPLAGAWDTLKQSQHMTGDMAQIGALAELALNIRVHGPHDGHRIGIRAGDAENLPVDRSQNTRILIGLTPDHHPMKRILIIGIGAGNPDYITMQAVKALNRTDVFFLMDKGQSKDKLIDLRREICERFLDGHAPRFAEGQQPERERDAADYRASVDELNRDKQAVFEQLIDEQMSDGETAAFMVWGDPSLYDSSIRIIESIAAARSDLSYDVIPGITSVQALCAGQPVPLPRPE